MMDDTLKEQASLYVAGALTPQEGREFEQVLNRNLELQLLVSQLRQSVDALVVTLPRRTPPPNLRARLLREVESRGAVSFTPPQPLAASPSMPWWNLAPWAAAAALAFLCVYLTVQLREAKNKILEAQEQMARTSSQAEETVKTVERQQQDFNVRNAEMRKRILDQSLENQKSQLARETKYVEQIKVLEKKSSDLERKLAALVPPKATPGQNVIAPDQDPAQAPVIGGASLNKNAASFVGVIRGTAAFPDAIGAVAWDANTQQGTLALDHLPPAPAGRDYQLWLLSGDVPISGGVITVDVNGRAKITYQTVSVIDTVTSFAISVENKGGARTPDLNSVAMASGSL